MSLKNKTKQIIFHESCKCVRRLDPIVCNNKQKWNKDKCRCDCIINKKYSNNFVWITSNCKCDYKKSSSFINRRM